MKKLILLVCLCSLLLVGCLPTPVVVDPGTTDPSTLPVTVDDACCFVQTDAGSNATYYGFATNSLKSREMGSAEKKADAVSSRTLEIMDKSFPVYYSVSTRPSGELNEVDAYANLDSTVVANYFSGTDELAVVTFADTTVSPKFEGELNEESLKAAFIDLLPESFDPAAYDFVYDGSEELGYQLVFVGKLGEFSTNERLTMLLDYEGHLMEYRLENYGKLSAVAEKGIDRAALEVAVSSYVQKAYRQADKAAITSVKLSSATVGADLDGSIYYTVEVAVEYTASTAAPSVLNLLYFPTRVAA